MKAMMLHSENSAVGYYRIWKPAEYLKETGWQVVRTLDEPKRIPIDKNYEGDDPELIESKKQFGSWEEMSEGIDILVMQRPDREESIALGLGLREQADVPLVFEVDDNIYDVPETSTAYAYWYPGSPLRDVAEYLMREADALTVSTPALKETYKHLNKNIYVLPNYQDMKMWKGINKNESDVFTIGWAGSSTHYDDLKLAWRGIKKFLYRHKDARFKVIGLKADFYEGHPQVDVSTDWVNVYDYPHALAGFGFDVGIVPLVNRSFNEGKSNIKWQEYSMLGIPTVASYVGEYKKIESILYADGEDMWLAQLEKLYDDAKLRKTLGAAAKQEVVKHYNIMTRITEWDHAYRDIIAKYSDAHKTTTKSWADGIATA